MCVFLPAAVGNSLPVRHCCYAFRCGVCNSCHGTWCYRAEFRGKDLSATTINDVHGRKVSHLFENTAHYALRPHTVGALSVDGRRLSVCLFLAWPSVDNGTAIASWKLAGMKPNVTPFRGRKVKRLPSEGKFCRRAACEFYRDVNVRLLYYELQAEISGWLFKSPLAGGGGILCRPQVTQAA